MVRWRAELQPSPLARRLSSAFFCTAALLVSVLPPFGVLFLLGKILLLGAIWHEWRRQRQRLAQRQGALVWESNERWQWQQQRWRLQRADSLDFAVMFRFSNTHGERQTLWLMRDSMPEKQWRALRYQLLSTANVADAQPPVKR